MSNKVMLVHNSVTVRLLTTLLITSCLKDCISADEILLQPELEIPQGTLRGINMVTRCNRKIFGFKGIPYAQPPVGNLRFKGPVPASVWNGTLDASGESTPCPQLLGCVLDFRIGRDYIVLILFEMPRFLAKCRTILKLGVGENGENSTLLPVMVYLFGGRFNAGSNNSTRWGPFHILDEDVLFVVPNSRLGVLGFLSTGDEVSPGNYGLKDIVCALKWVQDNIKYFGGDPGQVTFVGSSSGGMSVHLLTLSNMTNGLFHRYITQGGSALSPIAQLSQRASVNLATQLGKYLGCPTNTSRILVDCLKNFSPEQFVKMDSLFYLWKVYPGIIWSPTVEPGIEGALLTESAANSLATGKIRDLPWICIVVRDEGFPDTVPLYENQDWFQELLENTDSALPYVLQYHHSVVNMTAYTTALKSYYLNDLTVNRTLLLTNLTRLIGDSLFTYPIYSGVQQQLVHAKSPQYFGSFEYRGTVSYSYVYSSGSLVDHGVVHADELLYLFSRPEALFRSIDYRTIETDWDMVDTMVQLWTSFVITGIPTTLDIHGGTIWTPFSSRNNYLQIGNGPDTTLKVNCDFLKERMQFWNELTTATELRN